MQVAADRDPALAEYRIRREFGIRDDGEWNEIGRAVEAGRAAPVHLRSVARAVAEVRIRTLRTELRRPSWIRALGLLAAPEGLAWVIPGPRALRRRLQRLEAALAANAQPGPN
jgi:hypothetical protein